MPFIETNAARIYYETHGEQGQWVTLINGHTRSSSDFRMMTRLLVETGLFRVLLIDNRASGKSEVSSGFTMKDMCTDVVRVWDQVLIESSAVLGISMGGVIALGLAITHPRRISKLILVSSAPEESYIRSTRGAWIAEGNELEEKMRSYFAPGFVERNPLLFSNMINQIRQALNSGKFSRNSEMQREALKSVKWTDQLQKIQTPTLILHGEMDAVVNLEAATILKEKIIGSTQITFPGVGHLLLAEAPKDLYRVVIDFLEKN
jgi:3-oxoadipate enol-lactonase